MAPSEIVKTIYDIPLVNYRGKFYVMKSHVEKFLGVTKSFYKLNDFKALIDEIKIILNDDEFDLFQQTYRSYSELNNLPKVFALASHRKAGLGMLEVEPLIKALLGTTKPIKSVNWDMIPSDYSLENHFEKQDFIIDIADQYEEEMEEEMKDCQLDLDGMKNFQQYLVALSSLNKNDTRLVVPLDW